MIDRVEDRFGIKPERLIVDMASVPAQLLAWMVNDEAIEPHVPVSDRFQRSDDTLSSSDFQWDAQRNELQLPAEVGVAQDWRHI